VVLAVAAAAGLGFEWRPGVAWAVCSLRTADGRVVSLRRQIMAEVYTKYCLGIFNSCTLEEIKNLGGIHFIQIVRIDYPSFFFFVPMVYLAEPGC
jgi:hypothetical protein